METIDLNLKLLPDNLWAKLENEFPLYSQDGKGDKAVVVAHYSLGLCNWYVLEGNAEGDDFCFYGYADLGYGPELGYFTLSELSQVVRLPLRTSTGNVSVSAIVERDSNWKERPVCECEFWTEH